MSNATKLLLYLALVILTGMFGSLFLTHYQRTMNSKSGQPDPELSANPGQTKPVGGKSVIADKGLGFYGAGLVFTVIALGFMVAHDISGYLATRALHALHGEEMAAPTDPEYEQAEQEWANGNHLEAVRLMREYLAKKPKAQHAAMRIAEIYEKDLKNPLAAALEYEEILKHKLAPEQWGWAAIHLCNIYSSKLNQHEKAVELLRRIDTEYGETAAAEKARKRLAMLDGGGDEEPEEETDGPRKEQA